MVLTSDHIADAFRAGMLAWSAVATVCWWLGVSAVIEGTKR